MLKNSITLIETLISLLILSTVVIGFLKISYNSENNSNLFNVLNHIENNFTTKTYSNFIQSNTNLQITKNKIGNENENEVENLNVKKYEYLDNNIRVFKYEK
ncbi:hypothetical protein H0A43_09480 [Arcobacter lanthieri]|uniref:type IV pilus modification PilV family protein n=1 Tax=Aliarcobacter lanthieri TaxID=1355374 RepID=UPI00192380F7|nr:hypothetical protein [Aliarcobacter lanthieri]MBL3520703.1 hypothetical protein [Aliarcobacter lanthieri]